MPKLITVTAICAFATVACAPGVFNVGGGGQMQEASNAAAPNYADESNPVSTGSDESARPLTIAEAVALAGAETVQEALDAMANLQVDVPNPDPGAWECYLNGDTSVTPVLTPTGTEPAPLAFPNTLGEQAGPAAHG